MQPKQRRDDVDTAVNGIGASGKVQIYPRQSYRKRRERRRAESQKQRAFAQSKIRPKAKAAQNLKKTPPRNKARFLLAKPLQIDLDTDGAVIATHDVA